MTVHSPISIDNLVRIPMRDGVVLAADLYLPQGNGPFATLLCRTPYNRDTAALFAIRAAREGFAVVVQDVRGRWGSDGEWVPFVNEQRDGYDTCAWICEQAWSAGAIGTFGGSYVGLTQWQAALAGAPGLRAMAPAITGSNYHHGWTYQGGAFELGFNLSWTLGLAQNNAERLGGADLDAVIDRYDAIDLAFGRMPLAGDPLLNRAAPWYDEWLRHPDYDSFWTDLSIEGRYHELDVACFHTGGWLDIFLGGTVRNYVGMRTGAKTAWAREHQYLLINPRDHYTYSNGWPMGEYDPGVRSANAHIDLDGQTLRFFDRVLRNSEAVPFKGGNVSIFVMGEDAWRTEPEWPLARAVATDFYLHSGGKANTREGDGTLSREPPTEAEPADRYTYDPLNPVPTVGGPLCGHISKLEWGRRDQRAVEMRPDVLAYTTGLLAEPMEVTGPV
ncbi:MAG: CocE/NonD family hydrolase, partial [Chloroflexota bacterium]|nr:CocE/NonD family hydrolase [Chloroflexota bacterium]